MWLDHPAPGTIHVTVTPQNDAPELVVPVATHFFTTGTAGSFDASGTFTDPDAGDSLTWSATEGGAALPGWLGFNAASHVFSVTSTATIGLTSVTLTATDIAGLSASSTLQVSVSSTGVSAAADFLDKRGSATAVTLSAAGGADTVLGSAYADTINGGGANDQITGGGGNDSLTGGTGVDWFLYNEAASGNDTITDYVQGTDKLGFYASTTGVSAFAGLTVAVVSGVVHVSWNNGTGAGDVTLTGITATTGFTASDCLFYA